MPKITRIEKFEVIHVELDVDDLEPRRFLRDNTGQLLDVDELETLFYGLKHELKSGNDFNRMFVNRIFFHKQNYENLCSILHEPDWIKDFVLEEPKKNKVAELVKQVKTTK